MKTYEKDQSGSLFGEVEKSAVYSFVVPEDTAENIEVLYD